MSSRVGGPIYIESPEGGGGRPGDPMHVYHPALEAWKPGDIVSLTICVYGLTPGDPEAMTFLGQATFPKLLIEDNQGSAVVMSEDAGDVAFRVPDDEPFGWAERLFLILAGVVVVGLPLILSYMRWPR